MDAPSRRTAIHRHECTTPDTLASAHRPVWGDEAVETDSPWRVTSATAVRGPWELRVHVVESQTPQTATVREGGYAAPVHGAVSSYLFPVLGYSDAAALKVEGSNPMAAETCIPWLTGQHASIRSVHGSLAVLTGDPAMASLLENFDAATLMPVLTDSVLEDGVLQLTITAPDGKPLTAGFRLED